MKKIFDLIKENDLKVIINLAIIISVLSFLYYYSNHLITLYGDSKGHLNIARRVFDSPTPGFAQLGGYWLPFLHVLFLPTIYFDFFWETGISGAIPNMFFFVISVTYLYKLAKEEFKSKLSGLIASSVLFLNPNLLFIQSTPMTESAFLGTVVLSVYFYMKWIRSKSLQNLLLSGLFVSLSSLIRYEGWGLVAGSSVLLFFELIRSKFKKSNESSLILFSILAWLGIFLWIVWGAVIIGDPLDFMRNDLSAKNQTSQAYDLIPQTGKSDWLLAFATNVIALGYTGGPIILVLGLLGFLLFEIRRFKDFFSLKKLSALLLFTPFLFDVLTVYTGNVPVEVPLLSKIPPPGDIFNIRYSLFALPAIGFFIASFSNKRKIFVPIILLIVINSVYLAIDGPSNIILLKDSGAIQLGKEYQTSVSWFRNNYDNGLVVASTGGFDGYMYDVKLPLKNYITEGSYRIWDESMKNPKVHAKWILFDNGNPRDATSKSIELQKLTEDYNIVYKQQTFIIYKLKENK